MFRFPWNKKIFLLIIPGIIIAINNFPISAYISGRYTIDTSNTMLYMFTLDSFGVGLFEEIIFRGLLLTVLLQYLPKTKEGNFGAIVLSAAIFGAIHLFNLAYGGFISQTLMQVGYSFLMGLMWAVIYLKTKNIWLVAILHALYNYFGNILQQMGTVTNRFDLVTIIVTVVLALGAFIYYLHAYMEMDIIEE